MNLNNTNIQTLNIKELHVLLPDLYIRSTTDLSTILIDTLKSAGCHTIPH